MGLQSRYELNARRLDLLPLSEVIGGEKCSSVPQLGKSSSAYDARESPSSPMFEMDR